MIFVCFIIICTAYIFTIIYSYFECSLLDLGVGFVGEQTFSMWPSVHSFLMHAFESHPDYNGVILIITFTVSCLLCIVEPIYPIAPTWSSITSCQYVPLLHTSQY